VTLRQLEYFLAVVSERSFRGAALKVKVAQPSLSQQIRALEAELGVQLIERLPGRLRLTGPGEAVLPHARAAVAYAQRVVRSARFAGALEADEIEIATVRSLAVGMLPESIRRWRETHRGTLRLYEYAHRHELAEAVRAGVGDLGIGPTPLSWDGPIEPLGWQGSVLVLPRTDPLAQASGPVRLEGLADRQWVLFEPHHGLLDLVLAACAHAGFEPGSAVETSQVEAAARLAAAGLGPAIVPANAVPSGLDAAVLALDPPVGYELAAYAPEPFSPLVVEYLAVLRARPLPVRPPDAVVVR
jgi:DNA-binding transcriptional LysR family regulator